MTDSIHVLMGRVLAELPAIGKDDYNQQQKFHFRGIDAVLNALNPLLAKHGVFYVPEVVERLESQRQTRGGTVMYVVNLHVRYRFYGPLGDYVEASAWGEGTDMGDKATNKAMTGAMKYMLFQVFAISTAEASDADAGPAEETVPAIDCPEACGYRGSKDALRDHLHTIHHWPMTDDGRVMRPKPSAASTAGDAEGVERVPADPVPPSAPSRRSAPGESADANGGGPVPSAPVASAPRSARTTALMAAATQRFPERAERLQWAEGVLGRPVTTFGGLSVEDETKLLDRLNRAGAKA